MAPRPKKHSQPPRATQVIRYQYPLHDDATGKTRLCGKRLSYGEFRLHFVQHLKDTGTSWNKSMYEVYGVMVKRTLEERMYSMEHLLVREAEKLGVDVGVTGIDSPPPSSRPQRPPAGTELPPSALSAGIEPSPSSPQA
jgi:hypothetical protein